MMKIIRTESSVIAVQTKDDGEQIDFMDPKQYSWDELDAKTRWLDEVDPNSIMRQAINSLCGVKTISFELLASEIGALILLHYSRNLSDFGPTIKGFVNLTKETDV
jgi:hypothetical protein